MFDGSLKAQSCCGSHLLERLEVLDAVEVVLRFDGRESGFFTSKTAASCDVSLICRQPSAATARPRKGERCHASQTTADPRPSMTHQLLHHPGFVQRLRPLPLPQARQLDLRLERVLHAVGRRLEWNGRMRQQLACARLTPAAERTCLMTTVPAAPPLLLLRPLLEVASAGPGGHRTHSSASPPLPAPRLRCTAYRPPPSRRSGAGAAAAFCDMLR